MKDIKVEILPGVDFFPVFDFKHLTIVLVWWAETSLKNLTHETWVIIKPWWPFFKRASFFCDAEAEIFYPDESWPEGWRK